MNTFWKSLRSFAIVMGLAVFANGCIAEADVDAEVAADLLEATADRDALGVQGEDDSATDSTTLAPEDSETAPTNDETDPPPPPPPPPGGLCTGTSCTQV